MQELFTQGWAEWASSLVHRLSWQAWLIIAVNLALLVFARGIISRLYLSDPESAVFKRRLNIFRALNVLILSVLAYDYFISGANSQTGGMALIGILVVLYIAYLSSHLSQYFILNRYGKQRKIKGATRRVETYHTRLLTIFSQVFIFILVLIAIIRLLGFDTLLEAGGVIGIIGVFLALTNGVWAPDIFSGLIILNSDMLEEGDVIEIKDGEAIYGMVFKTKVFHTEILNLVNNHRIMIKNARLREQTVHNLSKFASAKGLRENIRFKIGYSEAPDRVRRMLQTAWDNACKDQNLAVQKDLPCDIAIIDNGDHAVEWAVFYYTKDVEQLPRTKQVLNEVFLETAMASEVALSTPMTIELTGGKERKGER